MLNSLHKKIIVTRFYILTIASLFVLIAIDQFTKLLAIKHLYHGYDLPVFGRLIQLTYVENTGVAFGLLAGKRLLFVLITVVFLAIFSIYYIYINRTCHDFFYNAAILLIIAGGIGNLIDRIGKSYVVDFIYVNIFSFPVFNVADIYVTCGSILFVIIVITKNK